MARITIRLADDLYDRIVDQARAAGTTPVGFVRGIILSFQGADPGGYHDRLDEIHATGIQTLAILAKSVGKGNPEVLGEGLEDARRLLRERGLLDPEQDRP